MSDKPKLKPGQRVRSRSEQARTLCKFFEQSLNLWVDLMADESPMPSRIREDRINNVADGAKGWAQELAALALAWNMPNEEPTFRALLTDRASPYHLLVDPWGDWSSAHFKHVKPLRDAVEQMRCRADNLEASEGYLAEHVETPTPEGKAIGTAVIELIADRAAVQPRLIWLKQFLDGNPNASLRQIEAAAKQVGHSLPRASINDVLKREKWIGHPRRGRQTKTTSLTPYDRREGRHVTSEPRTRARH